MQQTPTQNPVFERLAPQIESLQEIFKTPEVRSLIDQETRGMWDFCKGCKIGCPFEVSLYTHPLLAIQGTSDFWVDR